MNWLPTLCQPNPFSHSLTSVSVFLTQSWITGWQNYQDYSYLSNTWSIKDTDKRKESFLDLSLGKHIAQYRQMQKQCYRPIASYITLLNLLLKWPLIDKWNTNPWLFVPKTRPKPKILKPQPQNPTEPQINNPNLQRRICLGRIIVWLPLLLLNLPTNSKYQQLTLSQWSEWV